MIFNLRLVDRLLLLEVDIVSGKRSHWINLAWFVLSFEDLSHGYGDIVLLSSNEGVSLRGILRHFLARFVCNLPLLVEGTHIIGVLAEEVSFSGQTIGCTAQARDEAIFHVSLQANGYFMVFHVVSKAI